MNCAEKRFCRPKAVSLFVNKSCFPPLEENYPICFFVLQVLSTRLLSSKLAVMGVPLTSPCFINQMGPFVLLFFQSVFLVAVHTSPLHQVR